jgi:GT2 family glycosyltransferase
MTRPSLPDASSQRSVQGIRAALGNWLHQLNRRRLEYRRRRQAEIHYRHWSAAEQAQAEALRQTWDMRARRLASPPLFSVLWLPAEQDSTTAEAVAAALACQTYGHWELLTDRPLPPGAHDARLRSLAPQQDGNARFDALLAQARGDYVLLLRSGDRLAPPHALLLFAEAAERFQRPPALYADEDGLDQNGQRHSPWFKCAWNQELQRSAHYLGHAYMLRTDMVRRAGSLRGLPLEAAEQTLVLRVCDERCEQPAVRIPHLLLRRQAARGWRLDQAAPGTPQQAQALQAYLDERGIAARVTPSAEGGLHVRYAVPSPAPLVSLVVPTRNGLQVLRQCIDSVLQRTRYPNYEILIVDNGSDDAQTLAYMQQVSSRDPRVRIRRDDRPFNFSALNNHALPDCRGSLIGLLNNDTEVISPDWLDEMVGLACRPDVGAVGARLWYGNHTLQHAGVVVGLGGCAGHMHLGLVQGESGYASRACLTQEFSAVTAACLLMRRALFETLGGLDEHNLAVDLNDVDLCLKVREAGYRIVWTPFAELYHHESVSRGKAVQPAQRARLEAERRCFAQRWSHWLNADPAFHPALSLRHTGCRMATDWQSDLAQPWHLAEPAARTGCPARGVPPAGNASCGT